MNKSLSLSYMNEFGNQYDEELKDRVRALLAQKDKSIWENWEIRFQGTIKMIQGNDESTILEKSGIVINKLESTPLAGKLTLSLLPKFLKKDLSPIMHNILSRGLNLKHHPIVRLNLTGTYLNCAMMRILCNTILDHNKYKYLKWLNFTQCGLTTKIKKKKRKKNVTEEKDDEKDELYGLDVCSVLSVGLSKNKSLKFLFLSKNPSIDANGLNTILNSITKHPSLRKLIYNSNTISMAHAQVWSKWLANNPNLPRISMEHCNIDDEMFIEITNGLSRNSRVFELTLGKNMIGDTSIKEFSEKVLENNKTNIMRLTLFDNNITIKGCKYLSKALSINWTIVELDLSQQQFVDVMNKFDDEAVNGLCNGLAKNESLQTLRIGNNSLTSDCCNGLAELLKFHPNLNKLEVFYNKQIGEKGFQILSKGLEMNTKLRYLNMADTSPGKAGGKALKNALTRQYLNTQKLIKETTKYLRECVDKLLTKDNDFSNDLIKEIIETFVGYASLKQLDLKNCYPNLHQPGINDLLLLKDTLEKKGHELTVVW